MAKFPVHEDGPAHANSNTEPLAPAHAPMEHKTSIKETPGEKI
jgi:hypothetical protein